MLLLLLVNNLWVVVRGMGAKTHLHAAARVQAIDTRQARSYVHTEDLSRKIHAAQRHSGNPRRIYPITTRK